MQSVHTTFPCITEKHQVFRFDEQLDSVVKGITRTTQGTRHPRTINPDGSKLGPLRTCWSKMFAFFEISCGVVRATLREADMRVVLGKLKVRMVTFPCFGSGQSTSVCFPGKTQSRKNLEDVLQLSGDLLGSENCGGRTLCNARDGVESSRTQGAPHGLQCHT